MQSIIAKALFSLTIDTPATMPLLAKPKQFWTGILAMPSPSELQAMTPLFLQLLFFAVAGALLVGTFVSIVGLMYRYALFIVLVLLVFVSINYGIIDINKLIQGVGV